LSIESNREEEIPEQGFLKLYICSPDLLNAHIMDYKFVGCSPDAYAYAEGRQAQIVIPGVDSA
jgi:hypothetical protein